MTIMTVQMRGSNSWPFLRSTQRVFRSAAPWVWGVTCWLGITTSAASQQAVLHAGSDASHRLDTNRVVTTSFTEPTRSVNPKFYGTLGACFSVFKRALTMDENDHPPNLTPAHDTLPNEVRVWTPYPPAAIAAARDCYHATYATPNAVANEDVPALWPFALAMNEDSLARQLATRWLELVGPNSRKRADLLDSMVRGLVVNGGPWGTEGTHLTDEHVAMAREDLVQLQAMMPAHVLEWLKARVAFQEAGSWRLDSDANIQAAIDDAQQTLAVMQAVPPNALSWTGQQELHRNVVTTLVYGLRRLTYIKSTDHADLQRFVQAVDSNWPGGKRPWLVGTPAPPLSANYWFGTPSNTPTLPAAVPVANAVSLIVFIHPESGKPAANTPERDAMLRRLHAKYPALQIILMTVTTGIWANESLLDHPEREAQLMYHYVHDSLQVPGIMGVLTGKQRVATSDGRMLPVQLPLLDAYKLDIRTLLGQVFLVDRNGLVVDQGLSLVPLVPRLLAKSAHQ